MTQSAPPQSLVENDNENDLNDDNDNDDDEVDDDDDEVDDDDGDDVARRRNHQSYINQNLESEVDHDNDQDDEDDQEDEIKDTDNQKNEADDLESDEEEEEDDGSDEQDNVDAQDHDNSHEMLGGNIDLEAFALLTGVFFENPNDSTQKQVLSIPITRLPATLGRSHDNSDTNFFGLGTRKVLSRNQAVLFWRDRLGGQLVQVGSSEKLIYKPPPKGGKKDVIRVDPSEPLPELGFFAIECLGKNRIVVDGQRLDQGDVALLESGSTLKMNSYSLVFLLPTDAPHKVMTIPVPGTRTKTATSTSAIPTAKTAASNGGASQSGGGGNKAGTALSEHLDKTPIHQLLEWFFDAIQNNQWERRHQMIGGAITLHACLDAARSKEIQTLAKTDNGVSRSEVMEWIQRSPRYSEWVKHIMNKMEIKSYQANVTKCLWKAGYRRNAPVGRFVRWNLPPLEEIGPGEPDGDDEHERDDDNHQNTKGSQPEKEDGDAREAEDNDASEEDSRGEDSDDVVEEDAEDNNDDREGETGNLIDDENDEDDENEDSGSHDEDGHRYEFPQKRLRAAGSDSD